MLTTLSPAAVAFSGAAVALVCWPTARPRCRLAAASGGSPVGGRLRRSWPAALVGGVLRTGSSRPRVVGSGSALLAVVAVLGVLTVGLAVTVAVLLCVAAGYRHRRTRVRSRETVAACAEAAGTVRAITAELTAGAHPAVAVEAAACEAGPHLAAALRAVPGTAANGAGPGVGGAGEQPDRADGGLPEPVRLAVRRLSVAWSLADEHGIPLADLLDVVRRDLDATVRSARRTEARMAGPRTSAGVLALLPSAGIALGEATGAAPVAVLTGTGPGAALLIVGTGLVLAGVLWTSELTGRVMPR